MAFHPGETIGRLGSGSKLWATEWDPPSLRCRAASNGLVRCMCEDILRGFECASTNASQRTTVKFNNSVLCQGSTCFRWARSFAGAITQPDASTESPQTEPIGDGSCNMKDTRNTAANKQESIDNGLLRAQKLWTQTTQWPRTRGLDFSSPGRLPWS